MKKILPIAVFCVSLFSACGNPGYENLDKFGWMKGHWETRQQDILYIEEWTGNGAASFSGQNCGLTAEGDTLFRQSLSLQLIENQPYLQAENPGHKGSTLYKLESFENNTAIFSTTENIFPGKYTYTLEKSNVLHVRLDGKRKDQPAIEEITYEKTR